jgi:amino acid adenylation domain-containing protein
LKKDSPIAIKVEVTLSQGTTGKRGIIMEEKIVQNLIALSGEFDNERDYWKEKLSGELSFSTFPYDYAKKEQGQLTPRHRGKISFELPEEVNKKMMEMVNHSDFGVFLLLVTGLSYVLSIYSGNEDVIMGAPVFRQEDMESYTNKTIALRTRLDKNMSFKELLYQVKETVTEANDHMNFPLKHILKELQGTPEPSPIYDTMLLYESIHDKEIIKGSQNNVVFGFERKEEILKGVIYYNARLFKETTLQLIQEHLINFYRTVFEKPMIRLSEIQLSGATEATVSQKINSTDHHYSKGVTIGSLFSKKAEQIPEKIAIIEAGRKVTYRELETESNKVASLLQKIGVGINELVAIYASRTHQTVTGIMGILKSSCGYVPVDPKYPIKRIQYILKDSACRIIITESSRMESLLENIPSSVDTIICLDDHDTKYEGIHIYQYQDIQKQKDTNVLKKENEDHVAYVIYTSGSTGSPKGVMISHKAVLNTLFWMEDTFHLKEDDVVAQKTSISFTDSVWEFFWPLITGSKISIISDMDVRDPWQLYQRLEENQVTITQFVPPLMKAFLECIRGKGIQDPLPHLKWVFNGGEAIIVPLVKQWYDQFRNAKIGNIYGMTESAIYATSHLIQEKPAEDQLRIPLGKPIANTSVYVLGENREETPMNVRGEICIHSMGMTRGYLNKPTITDNTFCIHPITGKKLYCTKDKGFLDVEGDFQYVGRIDNQVQIRGNRVELGEVGNVLLKSPIVRDAVVIARQDQDNISNLYAYIIPEEPDKGIRTAEMRTYLSQYLPDYMIPQYFVQVDQWPLNPNGKIDRNALPDPQINAGEEVISPRNQVEESIRKAWSSVLELEEEVIGIRSNFFDLGGHSLKVITLASKIHKELKVNIPLIQIFKTPFIEGLADYINNAAHEEYTPLLPSEKKEYYPLSAAQQRLYILQQMNPESVNYNIPRITPLGTATKKEKLEITFKKLIERHESLRTSIDVVQGTAVQRVQDTVEFEIHYLEITDEETQDILNQFVKPFDLTKAPIIRVGMVKNNTQSILMIDMHHIITDAASHQVLHEEFVKLYEDQLLEGLKLQYKDYIHWLNKEDQVQSIQKQEEYWVEEFSGELPVFNLPTDHPRTEELGFEGGSVNVKLNRDETNILRQICRENDLTIYMLLFSLFNVLLAKISGQEDIIVGTPVAGRRHNDLDHIIGMFVNTLAIRNYPQEQLSFIEFVRQVREKILQAFENQDYQFDSLVKAVGGSRGPNRNPIFDVVYSYNKMEMSHLMEDTQASEKAIDFEGANLNIEHNIAHFDLMLFALETDEDLFFTFEYSTLLFKKSTIQEIKERFLSVISQVIEDMTIKIEEIELAHDLLLAKPIEDDYDAFNI